MAYPEINDTTFNQGPGGYSRPKGRGGHARFSGRGRGRNHGRNHFRGGGCGRGYMNYRPLKNDQTNKNHQGKGKYIQECPSRNHDDFCYRCRKKGLWFKTCRTPEYMCKRYKASVAGKEKEVNLNEIEPKDNTTCLGATDFVGGENEMD